LVEPRWAFAARARPDGAVFDGRALVQLRVRATRGLFTHWGCRRLGSSYVCVVGRPATHHRGAHSAPSAPKMVNNFCLARRVARFNSYYASVANLASRKVPRVRILITSRAARLLGDTLLRLTAFRQHKKLTSVLVSPSSIYHVIGECSSTRKIHLYRSRASKKKNSKKKTFKKKLRYKGGRLQKKKVIPTLVYALANRQHTLIEKEAKLRRFVRR
jgi:hypothetical protein